jgi:hypothetical protein
MTYLEIVNKVLRRLREDTVSTVNQNTYSALLVSLSTMLNVLLRMLGTGQPYVLH